MQKVNCLFGHQDVPELAFEVKDRLGQSRDTFQIMRCSKCGLLFVSPRPTLTAIAHYYPYENYQPFDEAIADKPLLERLRLSFIQNKRIRFIEKARTEGRLLDVGCATGNFLAQIRERGGWKVYGVEIKREAAEYAQQRFRLSVFWGSLEEANFPNNFFDVVTLWSVLEHLHNPLYTLKEVHRILRSEGGLLCLTIPYGDSLDARLFGSNWGLLDPPRHLYTYNLDTLELLLTRAGFEIVKVQCLTAGYLSLWSSIRSYIQNSDFVSNVAVRQILFRFIPSPLFRVLSFPYVWVTGRIGRGATVTLMTKPII